MNMYFSPISIHQDQAFSRASSSNAKYSELQKECFHMHIEQFIPSRVFFFLPASHLLLYGTNKFCCFPSLSQTFLHISPHSGLVYQTLRHFLTYYGLFLMKMSCIYNSNCNCCTCPQIIYNFKCISKRQLIFFFFYLGKTDTCFVTEKCCALFKGLE